MTERRISTERELAQVLANFRDSTRTLGPISFRIDHAALAVDLIQLSSAEELLIALREVLPEALSKQIVGILLDHDLTLDGTLDSLGGAL